MAAVVTSAVTDPLLQDEAERMGATFVSMPATSAELLAAVMRTLFEGPEHPGSIRPPFERRRTERRRRVGAPPPESERRIGDRRRDLQTLLESIGSPH
jgi:hypothetical protein